MNVEEVCLDMDDIQLISQLLTLWFCNFSVANLWIENNFGIIRIRIMD